MNHKDGSHDVSLLLHMFTTQNAMRLANAHWNIVVSTLQFLVLPGVTDFHWRLYSNINQNLVMYC